jgi:hypothetical protein
MSLKNRILPDNVLPTSEQCTIDLLTYYRCLPYHIPSVFDHLMPDRVILKTTDPAASCFSPGCMVWLAAGTGRSPGVRGKVLSFHPQDGQVEIGDLQPEEEGFDRRQAMRVEPKATIPARVLLPDQAVAGRLSDIGQDGAGLLIPLTGLTAAMGRGKEIPVQFSLRGKSYVLRSRVINCIEKIDFARLGLAFIESANPDNPEASLQSARAHISMYITSRQAEVDREIQQRGRALLYSMAA